MNGITGSAINSATQKARITGLSGFDTESMVKQLMQAEKAPLNSLFQKKTLVQWRQQAYRDITNTLKGFKSSFFDIVNRSSYMLSANSVKSMKASSSSSSYLDVTANSDADAGSINVKVVQVAKSDTAVTAGRLSKDISGTVGGDLNLAGKKIIVTLDGVSKEISLDNYSTVDTDSNYIVTKLQNTLNTAFGVDSVTGLGKISVGFNSGVLTIGTNNGATELTVGNPTSVGSVSGLTDLGLTAGASNRISLTDTLDNIKDKLSIPLSFSGDTISFTINGKLISANRNETLATVFSRINNTAEANATIKYDELTDTVSIASKQMGDGDNLKMDDVSGNFLSAMGMNTSNPVTDPGQDAIIMINGTQQVIRSTNNFTLNGVTYNLKDEHPAASTGDTITVSQDVDTAYNNIKSFIDKYNQLIDQLNGKISEKYDRDYLPLTDDQKANMKDTDITNWEAKAKTGILQSDGILQNIVEKMRTAMYEPVTGTDLTLKNIGISSNNYLDKGKLYIDEATLKDALRNKPDEVAKLLNGVDLDNPSYSRTATSEQRQSRYNKSGLFQRLSDIVEDNISTYRDSSNNKGTLLEKAGIEGDMTYSDNLLNDELDDYDSKIKTMQDRLTETEDRYYRQFSAMESYLQQMNSQSQWLAQQFGTGQ